MAKALIIVESPAKIKTLRKFLGPNYLFESSIGHVRDLPQKGFGIDVENNFEPEYAILPDKKDVIDRLKKAAKQVDVVYLAPDPDREGEAIAWHIDSILPKGTVSKRVTFNSITKDAVLEALKHPRSIDQALVDAQQARRLLDRIVGYKISPLLTRRVQGARDGGLSAGRVQSVALKLVVDREKEIQAFTAVEYWNIDALLQSKKNDPTFRAFLHSVGGKRVEKEPVEGKDVFLIPDEKTAQQIVAKLQNATYKVESVEKKEKKRNPVAPFITSTLQQEASRHYGFSASRTMNIAQGLYEGIDMGNEGAEGLITYMRTDSVRLAPESIDAARKFIEKTYGKQYLPPEGRQYSTKKSAQDAHEAIRPTSLAYLPESIKSHLTIDQFKLYQLIWRRFLASQMNPAIYDTVSCDIATDKEIMLRSTGSTIKFSGFLAVYEEKHDKEGEEKESGSQDKILPPLEEGKPLLLLEVKSEQAFTRPPPRFTEASLVKELEKSGIGRPSTYATIMNKIQSRDYTTKEKGTLKPTELGTVIAKMLEDNFAMIMDVGFTAAMEDELENVAEKKQEWKTLIRDFWEKFIPFVKSAEKEAHVPRVETDLKCPDCGHPLQKIWSRRKYFYGCSDYPNCKYTAPLESLTFDKAEYDPTFDWDQLCPKCGSPMKMRFGKFGAFLGCTTYPECKGIVNIPKKDDIPAGEMPTCPALGCDGKMVQRRSRFGKPFFSCSTFPDCDVIVNNLDDLDEKYKDHPKTPYVKKAKKGKFGNKKGEKAAPEKKTPTKSKKKTTPKKQAAHKLSKELEAVVGASELSRPEVIKKMWDYIKHHKLQDKKNKRLIVPDGKLAKVFGSKEPIDMMKLSGLLTKHID